MASHSVSVVLFLLSLFIHLSVVSHSFLIPSKLFVSVQLLHYQRSIVMSLSGFSSRFFHSTSPLYTCTLGFPAGYTRFFSSSSYSSIMRTSWRQHSDRACAGRCPPLNAFQSPSLFLSHCSHYSTSHALRCLYADYLCLLSLPSDMPPTAAVRASAFESPSALLAPLPLLLFFFLPPPPPCRAAASSASSSASRSIAAFSAASFSGS